MAHQNINIEGLKELKKRFVEANVKYGDTDIEKYHSDLQSRLKEYRLMYLFGAWVTSTKIIAEDDNEAIYDADREEKVASDKLEYALWCGNRLVKRYPKSNK